MPEAGLTAVTLLTALSPLPGEPALPLAAELLAPGTLVSASAPSALSSLPDLVALVFPPAPPALVLLPTLAALALLVVKTLF